MVRGDELGRLACDAAVGRAAATVALGGATDSDHRISKPIGSFFEAAMTDDVAQPRHMTPSRMTPSRMTPRLLMALVVAWLAIGVAAGTAEYLAARSGGAVGSWRQSLYGPVLAGGIWSLLTMGALALTERFPLTRTRKGHIAPHASAALAVSFVLNATFMLISYAIRGAGFPGWRQFPADTLSGGLQWLHINAGAYLAIVLLWQAYTSRSPARREGPAPGSGPGTEAKESAAPRVAARSGGALLHFDASEIDWIEGAGDYVKLHVEGREYLADERLRDLEPRLQGWGFLRVHRSAIVNLGRALALDRRTRADWVVVLPGGKRVNVSRARRRDVREAWSRIGVDPG